MARGSSALNIADYRRLARRRLPRAAFDFIDGGAGDETALHHNGTALNRLKLLPRRLVDVTTRSQEVTLFGRTQPTPLLIAPTGFNAPIWPHGDICLARAAGRAGIPFILSTAASAAIEDVARASGGNLWFQLYPLDGAITDGLVDRALTAGYSTLVLTVDASVGGLRERDRRNGFSFPVRYTPRVLFDGLRHPRWAASFLRRGVPSLANLAGSDDPNARAQAAAMQLRSDLAFDWDALRRLRDRWPRSLVVKGLLDPSDVARCAAAGVDGVVVSNHGGRQLDAARAPIDRLAACAVAAPGLTLLIDGGFRRGADVVKAVALGARGVLLGRATMYGLAVQGETGAAEVLRLMIAEIDDTLAQIGRPKVRDLSPDCVVATD